MTNLIIWVINRFLAPYVSNEVLALVDDLVSKLITPDMVKEAEAELVKYLFEIAKSQDNKLETWMVEIVAQYLNVPLPS